MLRNLDKFNPKKEFKKKLKEKKDPVAKIFIAKTSPRTFRLTPYYSVIYLHHLKNRMYRCPNYDESEKLIKNTCSLCRKGNEAKRYFAILAVDRDNHYLGWFMAPPQLMERIANLHHKYKICDINQGRSLTIRKYRDERGMVSWKISLAANATKIAENTVKQLMKIKNTLFQLYKTAYEIEPKEEPEDIDIPNDIDLVEEDTLTEDEIYEEAEYEASMEAIGESAGGPVIDMEDFDEEIATTELKDLGNVEKKTREKMEEDLDVDEVIEEMDKNSDIESDLEDLDLDINPDEEPETVDTSVEDQDSEDNDLEDIDIEI